MISTNKRTLIKTINDVVKKCLFENAVIIEKVNNEIAEILINRNPTNMISPDF